MSIAAPTLVRASGSGAVGGARVSNADTDLARTGATTSPLEGAGQIIGFFGGGIAGASLGFFNPGSARTVGCGGMIVLGVLGAIIGAKALGGVGSFLDSRLGH